MKKIIFGLLAILLMCTSCTEVATIATLKMGNDLYYESLPDSIDVVMVDVTISERKKVFISESGDTLSLDKVEAGMAGQITEVSVVTVSKVFDAERESYFLTSCIQRGKGLVSATSRTEKVAKWDRYPAHQ